MNIPIYVDNFIDLIFVRKVKILTNLNPPKPFLWFTCKNGYPLALDLFFMYRNNAKTSYTIFHNCRNIGILNNEDKYLHLGIVSHKTRKDSEPEINFPL